MFSLALVLMPIDNASSERLPLKIYTTAEGLARDRVNRIRKDSRGFLWFCTEEGLSRFDGYQFTNYSTSNGLPSSSVFDFLEASDGTYWVGTLKGLCRFNPYISAAGSKKAAHDGDDRMFIPYQPDDGQETVFAALFEDSNGTIWCGSAKGVHRLERDAGDWRLRDENIKGLIYNFIEDRQGALWIATDRGLCRRLRDGTVGVFTRRKTTCLRTSSVDCWKLGTARSGSAQIMGLCQLKREISPDKKIVSRVIDRYNGALIGGTWLLETANGHIWGLRRPGDCLRSCRTRRATESSTTRQHRDSAGTSCGQ